VPDIGKIYQILEVLQRYSQVGVSNKELSEALGLPPSTCSRILSSLRKYDFVYKRPSDSRYFLGFAHLRFAQSLLLTNNEVALCRPYLDDLYRRMEETVFYAKFNGNYCVVIDVRGAVNTRISVGLGELMPLHCSAAGKAVLAFIPEYERQKLYKKIPFDRYTEHTTLDVKELEGELADIQRTHLSFNHSEFHEGINAVASPVFNRYGSVVGAVAIVGTSAALNDESMKGKGKILLAASKDISEQLIRGQGIG
jgi:DNA-binding IclR family transcriptional regulator